MKLRHTYSVTTTYTGTLDVDVNEINYILHRAMGNSAVELTDKDIEDIIENFTSCEWFEYDFTQTAPDGHTWTNTVGDFVTELIVDMFGASDEYEPLTTDFLDEEYEVEHNA